MYAVVDAPNPVAAPALLDRTSTVDFIEAGAGPLVVLVHSSMAGARQWSGLIGELQDRFRVRALNLFGYGDTPAWSGPRPPTLDDYARLVALAVPDDATDIRLVGHSFGGAVAMQAAAGRLQGRVRRLVLFEPSLFRLLDRSGCRAAYREISALADYTIHCIDQDLPAAAAARFIDYWCGRGTWAASTAERRALFARSIAMLTHEWHAVLDGHATLAETTTPLPQATLLMASARTARPAREIADLLLRARPDWAFASICEAGHMAPVTHLHLVNPIIGRFLA